MHIRKEHNPGKHRLVIALVSGFTLLIGGVWAYQLRTMLITKPVFDVESSWQQMAREYDKALEYGKAVQQYLPESPDSISEIVVSATEDAQAELAKTTPDGQSLDSLAQALIDNLNAPVVAAEVTAE